MTPNHINKWTPDSLALALRQHGFDPEPEAVEPPSLGAAACRASLMTRAQAASRPRSLAARAYTIRSRLVRVGLLAGLSAINLMSHIGSWRRMSAGVSFVACGVKPAPGMAT
jgi:hypothetical protein